jgi:anti-sigma B factor antagonist
MTQVSYVDSSGVGELVSGFTYAVNRGGTLKILGAQKRTTDLLQITKLYTVFEWYNDEQGAIESFGPPRSDAALKSASPPPAATR